MNRVYTPRRMFGSVAEFARFLRVAPSVLYNGDYLYARDDGGYNLRPLSEAEYRRWHQTVYARPVAERAARSLAARDAQIVALRRAGHGPTAIGQRYGITATRVWQIVRAAQHQESV